MTEIRKMSAVLREDLEKVMQSIVVDYPYSSPDAECLLKKILGYGVDSEGNQIITDGDHSE